MKSLRSAYCYTTNGALWLLLPKIHNVLKLNSRGGTMRRNKKTIQVLNGRIEQPKSPAKKKATNKELKRIYLHEWDKNTLDAECFTHFNSL
jgi:hypothetical protein